MRYSNSDFLALFSKFLAEPINWPPACSNNHNDFQFPLGEKVILLYERRGYWAIELAGTDEILGGPTFLDIAFEAQIENVYLSLAQKYNQELINYKRVRQEEYKELLAATDDRNQLRF